MDPAVLFQTTIIPAGLFLVMMGLGLTLSIDDILRIIIMPKAVITGLIGQLILLPLVAFGLAFLMNPAPVIAIGLILLAACPGGITSNAYVFASRGDIALSVTLTTVASLFTVFTMPLLATMALTLFAEGSDTVSVPVSNMMRSLAQLTILPIALGMGVRKFKPSFAEKMVEPVRKMAIGILIMVIITNTYFSIDTLKQYMLQAGAAALILNITCMTMGYGLARLTRLNTDQTISITYEVGLQNLSLALVLANTLLGVADYAAVTLIYGFFMKFTALSFMAYAKKLRGKEETAGEAASV